MQSKPVLLKILDVLAVIMLGVSTYFALVKAPTELVMGNVQRVFYFHIGTAWTALIGWPLTLWPWWVDRHRDSGVQRGDLTDLA